MFGGLKARFGLTGAERKALPDHEEPAGATEELLDGAHMLDNRGLDPPEPLHRTLAFLESMASDEHLVGYFERRPMLLYPRLEERGFTHETFEDEDGTVRVLIYRAQG